VIPKMAMLGVLATIGAVASRETVRRDCEPEILTCKLAILWAIPAAGLLDELERFATEHGLDLLPALRRAVKYAAAGDSREDVERKLAVDGKVLALCQRLAEQTRWTWSEWLGVIDAAVERVVEHKRTGDALTFDQCEWWREQLRCELGEFDEWPRIVTAASGLGLSVAGELLVVILGSKHRAYPTARRFEVIDDLPAKFAEKPRRDSRARRLSRLSTW
jgi:hypothetical protein